MKLIYTGDFERLKDFGFEYDEYIEGYVKSIYSSKTKGAYVPFVHTGEIFIYEDKSIEDVISNRYFGVEKEHKEAVNRVYNNLIQAGLVKKEKE